jgi:thiamine kinase-like enzyme
MEVFDWVEGRRLNAARDAHAVAETLAQLHSHSVSSLSTCMPLTPVVPFIRAELRRYSRLNRGAGQIERILAEHTKLALGTLDNFPKTRIRSCLVHNDLVDRNVLCAEGRAWLIDWDWAMLSAPCIDLYCFLSPFVRSWGDRPEYLSARTTREFLHTYFKSALGLGQSNGLRAQAAIWRPHNTLLANWLYFEARPKRHTSRADFYSVSFENVSRLSQVIESFK